MKISAIEIKNFRLLLDFKLNLENDLSLVIGKNNTGKTSLLSALEKLVAERSKITVNDFTVSLREKLSLLISGKEPIPNENEYIPLGMELKLYITYSESDDLGQIAQLIMSLDPDDNQITLGFEYKISHKKLTEFYEDFQADKENYDNDALIYISEKHQKYFGNVVRKSHLSSNHEIYTDITKERISLDEVISFRSISAKRSVTNKENDKTLSGQTATIYKATEESEQQRETVSRFKKTLRGADTDLSKIYQEMFSKLLSNVEQFGGVSHSETSLKIASTLQHRELLEGNTTVLYRHEAHDLPEHFNGLGYMNLISMIFEINLLMTGFRKALTERPSAINLLFIEEPEAHTHPQMQYIFIKNIKKLLNEGAKREDGLVINLQTIITTHSSHIVTECDFDDIKYMKKLDGSVKCKDLKSLQEEYEKEDEKNHSNHFSFLKQYLTLNRAELFFADKAIFVEGDTERILLPAMMRKLDQESHNDNSLPLLSQNISIVEVGAHSQIFEKFIRFLGIKTLILTDIDTGKTLPATDEKGEVVRHKNNNPKTTTRKCPPNDLETDHTTNNSLCFFHSKNQSDIKYFLDLPKENKILTHNGKTWIPDNSGYLFTAYQTQEGDYRGRSFEDAFFSINRTLLGNDASAFPSLIAKHFNLFIEGTLSAFEFAECGVTKKTSLAIDILLNSHHSDTSNFSNWKSPAYIKEGLEWLRN